MASAVWIWLRVSYEAAVKLSARATVSQGHRQLGPPSSQSLAGAGEPVCKRACTLSSWQESVLAGAWPLSSPRKPLHRTPERVMTWQLVSDPKYRE